MKLMWKKRGGRKDKRGTEDSGIILFSASFRTTSSFSFSSTTHCHTVVHAVRQSGGGAEEGEGRECRLRERGAQTKHEWAEKCNMRLSLSRFLPLPSHLATATPYQISGVSAKGLGDRQEKEGGWAGCGWRLGVQRSIITGESTMWECPPRPQQLPAKETFAVPSHVRVGR